MPTLKAQYIDYDEKAGEKENLQRLFDAHNSFMRSIEKTINNLDEDNINYFVLEALRGNTAEYE